MALLDSSLIVIVEPFVSAALQLKPDTHQILPAEKTRVTILIYLIWIAVPTGC